MRISKFAFVPIQFGLKCGLTFALIAALSPAASAQALTKHVILVSIDGLGSQLLSQNPLPNIKKLITLSSTPELAETTRPVATIPGHVSMITGVLPTVHKAVWNENDEKLQPANVPTLFDLLREQGLESVFVTGKEKLERVFADHAATRTLVPSSWFLGKTYGRIPSVLNRSATEELKTKPALLFVHHALADTVGHAFGWNSFPQRAALASIDSAVGLLFDSAVATYGPQGFVMIVTADHGGHEASHGRTNLDGSLEDETADLYIPWIVYGAQVATPSETLNITDTAPSIAYALGLPVPATWDWSGRNRLKEVRSGTGK